LRYYRYMSTTIQTLKIHVNLSNSKTLKIFVINHPDTTNVIKQ